MIPEPRAPVNDGDTLLPEVISPSWPKGACSCVWLLCSRTALTHSASSPIRHGRPRGGRPRRDHLAQCPPTQFHDRPARWRPRSPRRRRRARRAGRRQGIRPDRTRTAHPGPAQTAAAGRQLCRAHHGRRAAAARGRQGHAAGLHETAQHHPRRPTRRHPDPAHRAVHRLGSRTRGRDRPPRQGDPGCRRAALCGRLHGPQRRLGARIADQGAAPRSATSMATSTGSTASGSTGSRPAGRG